MCVLHCYGYHCDVRDQCELHEQEISVDIDYYKIAPYNSGKSCRYYSNLQEEEDYNGM